MTRTLTRGLAAVAIAALAASGLVAQAEEHEHPDHYELRLLQPAADHIHASALAINKDPDPAESGSPSAEPQPVSSSRATRSQRVPGLPSTGD